MYGDVTLPAGEYDTLRIELGSAVGKNWWCIVFPNLCYIDSTYHVVPESSKNQLKLLLTDEEYDAITMEEINHSNKKVSKVVIKFKLFDWFKGLF